MLSRAEMEDIQSSTRGYFHTTESQTIADFAAEFDVELPYKNVVCPTCNGSGTQSLHGLALRPEDVEDRDFMDDYRRGVYDTPCEECGGRNVVREPDYKRMSPEVAKDLREWIRDTHRANAESLMERRMGA